jgi:Class II flagellar assembly regulator
LVAGKGGLQVRQELPILKGKQLPKAKDRLSMKVKGPGRISTPAVKKTRSRDASDGRAFSDAMKTEETSAPGGMMGTAQLTSVDALLSLQEVPDASSGRSKGLIFGKSMLDHLEEIRRGILLGTIPRARLMALSDIIRSRRDQFQDPRLTDILDQIELRARVELAKMDSA